jgi:hypothetical protein
MPSSALAPPTGPVAREATGGGTAFLGLQQQGRSHFFETGVICPVAEPRFPRAVEMPCPLAGRKDRAKAPKPAGRGAARAPGGRTEEIRTTERLTLQTKGNQHRRAFHAYKHRLGLAWRFHAYKHRAERHAHRDHPTNTGEKARGVLARRGGARAGGGGARTDASLPPTNTGQSALPSVSALQSATGTGVAFAPLQTPGKSMGRAEWAYNNRGKGSGILLSVPLPPSLARRVRLGDESAPSGGTLERLAPRGQRKPRAAGIALSWLSRRVTPNDESGAQGGILVALKMRRS